jgi:hypothetical protein
VNETNRTIIVLAAGLWIVLMAVFIFLAWTADTETVDRLGDFVEYLDAHRDDPSRLILTLGALVLIVLALLLIIVELAPEEETREIRVQQAGATTIVPAEPLRLRLEEALTAMPQVTAAKARVQSQDRGVGLRLDLTVVPGTNLAVVTQEASRVVVETLQADLGLPVAAPPVVRIAFGPPRAEPVASSVFQPPAAEPPPAESPPEQRSPWTTGPIPSPSEPETPPPSPWGRPASEEPPAAPEPPPDDPPQQP